jgi:hypothetical protein
MARLKYVLYERRRAEVECVLFASCSLLVPLTDDGNRAVEIMRQRQGESTDAVEEVAKEELDEAAIAVESDQAQVHAR